MGVPSLTCHCRVCSSTDPRDKRLRPSILLVHNGRTVVIDTTPDFRYQELRVGLEQLDAILFTHARADHMSEFLTTYALSTSDRNLRCPCTHRQTRLPD